MNKGQLSSFVFSLDLIFLAITIYNNSYYDPYNYSPYNQAPPYNQNFYNLSNVPVYPNRTEAEKELTARIEAAFQDDYYLSSYASNIVVYTVGQEVTLSGSVDSDRIRLAAESKAKNTLGVKRVNNLINVEKTK